MGGHKEVQKRRREGNQDTSLVMSIVCHEPAADKKSFSGYNWELPERQWGKSSHCKLRASPAKATMELPFARNHPVSL
jgi:hypothetical protein